MKKTTLNNLFSDWLTGGGIFSLLQGKDVPWKDKEISLQLDLYFHGNFAGSRIVSPLLLNLLEDGELTEKAKDDISNTLVAVFGINWQAQYDTLSFEYNPIENYRMTENMENDITITQYGHSVSRTGTDTSTPNTTVSTKNDVYAFNSADAVSDSTQSQTQTGSNTMEYNTTNSEGGEDKHTHNYTLTRSGNIGVTTTQQMLTSQRELWLWNFFIDIVFPNVRDFLTLKIY